MAGRFVNPFPQFLDATPAVRSGAKLFFYAAGTSTKLNTYSDRGLTVANTNPVVLNSAGYPSVDIYLQDLDYKVVLAPSTDTDPPAAPIWSADYVNARDSKLIAKTLTGSGSPSGSVAGTAGSSSILPDFYWDYTNSILYVCTTTGTSSTAVWTGINASAASQAVPPPQGRLTLTSATPVLASDASAQTTLYYTPFVGNLVPIYNGSTMVPTEFAELSLSLVSAHASNTLYDVFVFSNSGVLTLATGPAWTTSTAGSGARGSGAATTQLARVKGLWVNAVAITGRNGSTTYSIGANLGTYLGSISMDGSAGQLTCHTSYGQSRKWGVWNAYNRVSIKLMGGDNTASWTNPGSLRNSNSNSANKLTVFCGLPEEIAETSFIQITNAAFSSQTCSITIGIGLNSAAQASGSKLGNNIAGNVSTQGNNTSDAKAAFLLLPRIGINDIFSLESSSLGTATFNGGASNMLLSAIWRG